MGGSPPGSAGVPPAQHWQSLAHLLDPDRPAKAPGLCLGRAHAVPTGTVDGCAIAGKTERQPKGEDAGGTPRSRVGRFRHDCPSRESRRKRTGWMVALNPELTIPWCPSWPFVDNSFFFCFQMSAVSSSGACSFPKPSADHSSLFTLHSSLNGRQPEDLPGAAAHWFRNADNRRTRRSFSC